VAGGLAEDIPLSSFLGHFLFRHYYRVV